MGDRIPMDGCMAKVRIAYGEEMKIPDQSAVHCFAPFIQGRKLRHSWDPVSKVAVMGLGS